MKIFQSNRARLSCPQDLKSLKEHRSAFSTSPSPSRAHYDLVHMLPSLWYLRVPYPIFPVREFVVSHLPPSFTLSLGDFIIRSASMEVLIVDPLLPPLNITGCIDAGSASITIQLSATSVPTN